MVALCVVGVFWVILVIVASVFAKQAGEKDWKQFWAINVIPLIGSLISIFVYAIEIGKRVENEREKQ